jgi:endonuclease IV
MNKMNKMNQKLAFGLHVSKDPKVAGKKAHKSIFEGIKAEHSASGVTAVSLFTHGPKSAKKNEMDYAQIRKFCQINNISIYPHGSYTSVGVWKVNTANAHTAPSAAKMDHVLDMLQSARALGARGLVIHLPKDTPDRVVETMRCLSDYVSEHIGAIPTLLLEMPASKPDDKTYETPAKLNRLCRLLDSARLHLDWGLCIDTSHLYSCGVDLARDDAWQVWLSDLAPATKKRIKLIHLNGGLAQNFGKGKDVHIIPLARAPAMRTPAVRTGSPTSTGPPTSTDSPTQTDAIWGHCVLKEMAEHLAGLATDGEPIEADLYALLTRREREVLIGSSLGCIIKFAQENDVGLICEMNRGTYVESAFALDVIAGLGRDLAKK